MLSWTIMTMASRRSMSLCSLALMPFWRSMSWGIPAQDESTLCTRHHSKAMQGGTGESSEGRLRRCCMSRFSK